MEAHWWGNPLPGHDGPVNVVDIHSASDVSVSGVIVAQSGMVCRNDSVASEEKHCPALVFLRVSSIIYRLQK